MGLSICFDFNSAVNKARKNFPAETQKITFVNLADPDAEKQLENWLYKCSRERRYGMPAVTFAKSLAMNNGSSAFYDPINDISLLMVRKENEGINEFSMMRDKETFKAFTFAHEFGHLLMKNGISDFLKKMDEDPMAARKSRERNMAEIAAESFGIFYLLHQGMIKPKDLYDLGLFRVYEAINLAEIDHLTTLAIDDLLLKSEDTDFISLSAAEIKAIAEEHAAENTRTAYKLDEAIKKLGEHPDKPREGYERTRDTQVLFNHLTSAPSIRQGAEQEWVKALAQHCLAAEDGSLEFHFAARVLIDVFETNHLRFINYHKVDTSGPEWDTLKTAISDRVQKDPVLCHVQNVARGVHMLPAKLKTPNI